MLVEKVREAKGNPVYSHLFGQEKISEDNCTERGFDLDLGRRDACWGGCTQHMKSTSKRNTKEFAGSVVEDAFDRFDKASEFKSGTSMLLWSCSVCDKPERSSFRGAPQNVLNITYCPPFLLKSRTGKLNELFNPA